MHFLLTPGSFPAAAFPTAPQSCFPLATLPHSPQRRAVPAISLLCLLGATQVANSTCWQPLSGLCIPLEVEGLPSCRAAVEMILGSAPETPSSHRCQPGPTSSAIRVSYRFFSMDSELRELLFIPQIPVTKKDQTHTQVLLPNSGLSSDSHPPFPYISGAPVTS